ncbi:MAG: hypothetical protein OXC00_12565, partial [Acidimicrobiaceae bacterium]|nr:hypothetical protein [Acidimicrobiaceae bacterium]
AAVPLAPPGRRRPAPLPPNHRLHRARRPRGLRATAFCAPIFGSAGPVAAMSVLGPAERLVGRRLDRATTAVVEAATATSYAISSPEAERAAATP